MQTWSIFAEQIAALLHVSERQTGAREAAAGVTVCCEGVRNTCKSLLKRRPDLKPLVQHHVIPVMHEMRTVLRGAEVSDAELACNCEAKCLHCVEYIEGRVGDYESRELTLREAIAMVEGRLGVDCKKLGVYSLLLNNLACTFEVSFLILFYRFNLSDYHCLSKPGSSSLVVFLPRKAM